MNNPIILKGLQASHFMHPGDRVAIEKLKTYKKFKQIMEKMLVEGLEDDMYLMSLADNVKLGPKQGKNIYDMLLKASNILDVNPPALFMDTDPVPNAYAFGEKKPIVILTSGLVDSFSDEEIFAVISHELGHIKCRHTLYSLMAQNIYVLIQIFSLIPILGAAVGIGFYLTLMAWYRRSELSADRAALLATQSKDLISKTMMKLAGAGSNKIYETLSLEPFLEQAQEYEDLQSEMINSGTYKKWAYIFGTFMTTAFSTHPWPALRTKEAIKFYGSDRYERIISKNYPTDEEKAEGIFASEGITRDIEKEDLKQDFETIGKDIKEKTVNYGVKLSGFLKNKLQKVAEDMQKDENITDNQSKSNPEEGNLTPGA